MTQTIAVVQMNSGDSVAANLAAAETLLAEAAVQGAGLAVLPENFAFMGANERAKLAHRETLDAGPIQSFLADAAKRHRMVIVGGTLPLAVPGQPDKVYAASLVYGADGQRLGGYHKIHLFDVDVQRNGQTERYRESNSIEYGEPVPVTLPLPLGTLGLSVCYDLRFPELYRRLSTQGAAILTVPSAFTYNTGEAHWETLLRARAIENQCYVMAPNQTGTHPGGRTTWGHSMIVDPWGRIAAQRESGAGLVLAEYEPERLAEIRRNMPCLQHRRIP